MTNMPTMRAAFRTTVSGGGKYEMIFRFHSMEAMHAADDEWHTLSQPPEASGGVLRGALKTADSWLERWASHVGNCRGASACTCGLTRVQYEIAEALAQPAPEQGEASD